jgi:hypothetical protein
MIMAGSRVGKSYVSDYVLNELSDKAWHKKLSGPTLKRNGSWYNLFCTKPVAEYIKSQNKNEWVDLNDIGSFGLFFEISEPLYLMILLKFPEK